MIALFKYLRAIHPLSNELCNKLKEVVKIRLLAKKSYVLKVGQTSKNIYFVEKGMLWHYYFQKGKTISSAFTKENEVCLSLKSFYSQEHGEECIQALEYTALSYISYQDYQELTNNFPEFNTIARILLERCAVLKEQRLTALWMQSAQDRFNWLVSQHPELILRVPGKCLASYLGMTSVMLSRLKGQRK